jgi:hypothetical protein
VAGQAVDLTIAGAGFSFFSPAPFFHLREKTFI